jgi:pyruvate-formate lyase-activating enzyme
MAWARYYPIVRIGGPAFGDPGNTFTPGQYVRQGVTFTSRGCDNRCPWCFVPKREGRLTLLPITEGQVVQDNNLLQTPRDHQESVYAMLKRQGKVAAFSGGIQASLVDDWVAAQFRQLRINEVWLACDSNGAIGPLRAATRRLSFLRRDQLRCYVLVGFGGETVTEAARRLAEVWDAGCMPFAQFYRDGDDKKMTLTPEWHSLVREWSRPAAMRVMHRGTQ